MRSQVLAGLLERIAALPGMVGCAVVDVDTGMAWETAGDAARVQHACEAASDYWRLYLRNKHEYALLLGELAAQVMVHAQGRVTIVPCKQSLLLVCLSHEPDRVDWRAWKSMLAELTNLAD